MERNGSSRVPHDIGSHPFDLIFGAGINGAGITRDAAMRGLKVLLDHSLRVPLSPEATVETGVIVAEILYAFRRELAEKLGDALLRRSMVGMGPRVALDVDEAAARVAVQHLGWSRERAKREVEEFRDYVRRYKPKGLRETEPLEV
jgi:glycerol-3-phosphate dehydrogenase